MNNVYYEFSDFIRELQNLYMVRLNMSISESSRYLIDTIEDVELAVKDGKSAYEYFQEELASGVEV